MARIRTIKPGHVSDKALSQISLQAHLLWILTWPFSDDDGVFENDILLLRSQLFPRRTDIRVEQIRQWLDQLEKARFIVPFEYNGEGYYIHRTFKTHQKIDRPQPSKIPSDIIRRTLDEYSTTQQPCIVKDSIVEESRGTSDETPPLTPEDLEFKAVKEWIDTHAPTVNKLQQPLTKEQYFKLKERFSPEFIETILLEMHNWKPLLKSKTSAYLTFIKSFAKNHTTAA